jgi:DNA-binding winged helix-turn-helix (wHTH) protein
VVRPVRFRFDDFVLAPRQRVLLRGGTPVPLIPKYFDLLVVLVERRHDAVSKDAIFSAVWRDVVVSDGALAQAVRTLRRTLGDNSREPKFIRTVSRHGYQFVYGGVIEEPDDEPGAGGRRRIRACRERSRRSCRSSPPDRRRARRRGRSARPRGTPARARHRQMRWPRWPGGPATRRRWRSCGTRAGTSRAPAAYRSIPPPRSPWSACVCGMRAASWPGAGPGPRWPAPRPVHSLARSAVGAGFLSPGSSASLRASLALAALGALCRRPGRCRYRRRAGSSRGTRTIAPAWGLVVSGATAGLLVAAAADLLLRALVDGLVGHVALTGNSLVGRPGDRRDGRTGLCAGDPPAPGRRTRAPKGRRRVAAAGIVAAVVAAGAAGLASRAVRWSEA